MSWHFSRELVEEFSAENSSDGGQSAPSSGTPTHGTFWSPDKTMDASTHSRSGMTFRPSTDAHGEAVLMWCLAAFRARTFQPLEKEPESAAIDPGCGWKWPESSVKFDPASRSWRTRQCSLLGGLEPASETWPRWGMMRDGESWEQSTPELLTSATESGSWRSPAAQEPGISIVRLETRTGEPVGSMCRHYDKHTGRMAQIGLTQQVQAKMFPTPYGLSANQGQGDGEFGKAIRNWPTPAARDGKGANSREHCETNGTGRKHMDQLANAVAYPDLLGNHANAATTGGQLNPTWVEWLMGWPLGWTDCAVSATDKFRKWLDSHGKS
jgi:hypothetical protein